jgi:hypothetical protein
MESVTELPGGLGCRLSFHTLSLEAIATSVDADDFEY